MSRTTSAPISALHLYGIRFRLRCFTLSYSRQIKSETYLSVNQLAAQIKLVESWKAVNLEDYPIQLENNQLQRNTNGRAVRESTVKLWKDGTKSATAKESFLRDAAKLWNNAPLSVKNTNSIFKVSSHTCLCIRNSNKKPISFFSNLLFYF